MKEIRRDIILYKRYIDDILIIGRSKEFVDDTFRRLHRDKIAVTRSVPDEEGCVLFLNMEIRHTDGHVETRWYKKLARKDIIMNMTSAHLATMKRQIIRYMLKTASELSSTKNRQEAENRVKEIGSKNGYHGK